MKKIYLISTIFLIPTLMFGMCTTKEKQEMKGSGYSSGQILDICSEENSPEEESSSSKSSYISLEAAYVGEGGPGFYKYQGYYGDTITESQSVSGSGFSVGIGYTFSKVAHIKLKYKKLTSSWEDDYGNTLDNLELSETTLSYTATTNPSGDIHFGYGAFIGFGSTQSTSDSVSFFTYGPEIGLIIDATDNIEFFTDLTWQERKYKEINLVTYDNFPFSLDIGLRYNFR